ncbi:MAG: DNA mismatch repair endonuclease MutL [Muricoprocola sp.]
MNKIAVLDDNTIDKIAAGEVIERPASVVKELVENAIDAGANAVTVEIKDGGISLIRITDNGSGIEADQVPTAFLRHATSKIRTVEDLLNATSLGFRGEALSSIAAVCQVELITKTPESLTAVRYLIEGGKEKGIEEIGAPPGTTFLVRNLFFNTPARKKFLKTAQTEAGYVSDLMEHIALSHPEVSFKFISSNQTKLHTSGNHNLKDIIYNIYGRDIANQLLEIDATSDDGICLKGFIGKPIVSRGNRNFENYFVNGRYIRSKVISKAIEDAYGPYMMKHKYPFTVLHLTMDGEMLDVNVHPAKMELRFQDNEKMYDFICKALSDALSQKEMIPQVSVGKEEKTVMKKAEPVKYAEPFEKNRIEKEKKIDSQKEAAAGYPWTLPKLVKEQAPVPEKPEIIQPYMKPKVSVVREVPPVREEIPVSNPETVHEELEKLASATVKETDFFSEKLLDKNNVKEHKIIGQLFKTYWLVEFKDNLFIIDQHAAHEKVLYERTMKSLKNRDYTSQLLNPPIILSLSMQEENLLQKHMEEFTAIGYEIESFGGREYALRAVPDNLFGIAKEELFIEMLDSLSGQTEHAKAESIYEKIASMSCKAAVKGNHQLSLMEVEALIDELLTLDNPYHCPHGRPTIVSMSKYEIEKKFKRIV